MKKGCLVAPPHETERNENYPERTVYELTEVGRTRAQEWLEAMLATPRNEFPQFPAALSFVMLLPPQRILPALERRAASLEEHLGILETELGSEHAPHRLFLLETEYLRDVTAAELRWVRGVTEDLRENALSWSEKDLELARAARSYQQSMAETGKRSAARRTAES